ncbi:MAG TPA: ABC transporter ATP-binding protein [Patescibacteria group bacterium]|nr:ABC transporter ATP-binding protein [Patescibacteria group bacterium]
MTDFPVLEARGLTKRFPGVLANDHVDLTLMKGEVHALLGENGAGKTTLMNMLYGLYHPDEGEILVDGKPIKMDSPNEAIAAGIGMVHQHFMLIPVMSVTENIMLGLARTRGINIEIPRKVRPILRIILVIFFLVFLYVLFQAAAYWIALIMFGVIAAGALVLLPLLRWMNRQGVAKRIQELSESYNLPVNPDDLIKDLPVGLQQRVEIIKALYRNADILILDEPTAVLTPQETEEFFVTIRNLQKQGTSIIFISHKLKEVLAIANRISVLHHGRSVGTAIPEEATEASLAEMMVGRKVILQVDKSESHPGKPILQTKELVVEDERGQIAVEGVSFDVRAGEILGIAGVQGNGQRELVEGLTGLRPIVSGHVFIDGQETTGNFPRTITELGVAHIPEDREKHGLVMGYSVADNLVLNRYYQPPYARGPRMDYNKIAADGKSLVEKFDVRTPSVDTLAGSLSGGNKQKVIVAREFSRPVKLLIANQPTRGIDVGSIEFIHNQIIEQRDAGSAVLLVSAELDEILSLADRVAVMFDGRIVKILPIAESTRERLGLLMAGSDA